MGVESRVESVESVESGVESGVESVKSMVEFVRFILDSASILDSAD